MHVSLHANQLRREACKFLLKMNAFIPNIHRVCVSIRKEKKTKPTPSLAPCMFWRHANNLGGYVKTFGEKKTSFLGGNIFYLSISWVYNFFRQTFGLTSGAFVRGMVGSTLVRKGFNYLHWLHWLISSRNR